MKYLICVEDSTSFAAEIEVQDENALLREAGRILTDIIGDEFAANPSGAITLTATTVEKTRRLTCTMEFSSRWIE